MVGTIKPFWRYFLALLAGGLLPLAFAPFWIYPLAMVSPAILLALWLQKSAKQAFWTGFLFGLGFFGVGASWVFVSIHEFGNTNGLLAFIITLLFVSFLALYPACQGLLLTRFFPQNNFSKMCLAFPSSWVLLEWLRGWFLTGFPWLFLGASQITSPLRGFIPVVGEYGVSFLVVLSASLIVLLISNSFHSRKVFYPVITLLCIWLVGGLLSFLNWSHQEGNAIKVSLIQGNIPQQMKWDHQYLQMTIDRYYALTQENWNSNIIVWPEAAIPMLKNQLNEYLHALDIQARDHHAALIMGIPLKEGFDYYNGIIALGTGQGVYYKRHLVPFGEYVPFDSLLRGLIGLFDIPMSNFSAGPKLQADLRVANNLNIAPFICYEIAYPHLVLNALPQADLLLTVSNDAWFGDSFAPAQHLQIAQVRALESGRYLLFSNNTGKSAIIDAQGKIQAESKMFATTVLTHHAVKMVGITPFVRIGIYPVLWLIFGFLGLAVYLRYREEKNTNSYSWQFH